MVDAPLPRAAAHEEQDPSATAAGVRRSPLRSYQQLVVGSPGIGALLRYETLMFFVNDLPGLAGLWLRSKLYRGLFARLGRRVALGRGLVLRQPGRISIDEGAVIDEGCSFKVRGDGDSGIWIGRNVFVGRLSSLNVRGGQLHLLEHANIGPNVHLGTNSRLSVGRHCIVAAFCQIGGLNHRSDRLDVPMALQGMERGGGVEIEDDVWLGAGAIVLDGVRVGRGAIVGAGAVVTRDVPALAVVAGVPARVVRLRGAAPDPPASG